MHACSDVLGSCGPSKSSDSNHFAFQPEEVVSDIDWTGSACTWSCRIVQCSLHCWSELGRPPGLDSGRQVQLPDSLTPTSDPYFLCALQPSVRQWARVDQEVRLEPLQAVLQVLQQGSWVYQGKWERGTMSLPSMKFSRNHYLLIT
jgi:hypothetical protein